MQQQRYEMNNTAASQDDQDAGAEAGENMHLYVDSPPITFASTLGWTFQATLPPVVVQQNNRSPSPVSVMSTSIAMHQPSFAWATYSEPHPHYPSDNYNSNEAASASGQPDSSTQEVHHVQPSAPYADADDPDCDNPLLEYSAKSLRGKDLFVYHLPSDMTEEELRELFSQHGDVISASIMHHDLGVSKCYAIVKFKLQSAADNALLRLNHYEVSIM
jgi:hypothetical protein